MQNVIINLRASPEQRDLIDSAAKALGKNRTEYMLDACCAQAKEDILDQRYFALTDIEFDGFEALIKSASSAKNPALDALLARPSIWVG